MNAPIKNIKEELQHLSYQELLNFTLHILKYKKENKELAHYLLFEKQDEDGYADKIISLIKVEFSTVNFSRPFFARKGFRRINRLASKYLKYSGEAETSLKVFIFLMNEISAAGKKYRYTNLTDKIVDQYLVKSKKIILTMHEDLQFEYENLINNFKS